MKDAGREARTRRLIEAGGLVKKTGLVDLDANALYGALLSLREGSSDTKQIEKSAALGGRTFAREAHARDEGKEPILLTFPAALAKEATATLRTAGFRFNKVLQHWEVLARIVGRMDRLADSVTLLRRYGAQLLTVRAGPVPAQSGLFPLAKLPGQHLAAVLRHGGFRYRSVFVGRARPAIIRYETQTSLN